MSLHRGRVAEGFAEFSFDGILRAQVELFEQFLRNHDTRIRLNAVNRLFEYVSGHLARVGIVWTWSTDTNRPEVKKRGAELGVRLRETS